MYKFKNITNYTFCVITSLLLVGCLNDAVAQQLSTVRMDGLRAENTYIPPRKNPAGQDSSIEKAYYYEDIVLKGEYFNTEKDVRGIETQRVDRLYFQRKNNLRQFGNRIGREAYLNSWEKGQYSMKNRPLHQSCNLILEENKVDGDAEEGPLAEYYWPRYIDSELKTSSACEPTDITIGTITEPNVSGEIIEKSYRASCQIIDFTHPAFGEMYADNENDSCYEFSECIDPDNHKSINDLCESDGRSNCNEIDPYGRHRLCLYQIPCKRPPKVSDRNISIETLLDQNYQCDSSLECASRLCVPLVISKYSDYLNLKDYWTFRKNYRPLHSSLPETLFGGLINNIIDGPIDEIKFCAPVAQCQYNYGDAFDQIPKEGYCANITDPLDDSDFLDKISLDDISFSDGVTLSPSRTEYFCTYSSAVEEIVGELSAQAIDEETCGINIKETNPVAGNNNGGPSITSNVFREVCIKSETNGRLKFVKEAKTIQECDTVGGEMYDGQDFVHDRFRKTSRLFSVLEYIWGQGNNLDTRLKDPRSPGIDEDLWTYPVKLKKIMLRNADLRREIEQDRRYYIEKRRLFGDYLSKYTSAGQRGDTTGLAYMKLQIHNDLEEASLSLRSALMYAVMLGLIDGEDVMDRAFLYNGAGRESISVSSESLSTQMGKTNAQSEEKKSLIDEILSNEKQTKMLSKAGFITGNFWPNKAFSLPEIGKDLSKAQDLSTCNMFKNRLEEPEGCVCSKINHNTICGNQCVPVNYDHKGYTTFYNSMCVQDAQIIELEDGKDLIMVDGFFPTDLIRPKDPRSD